MGPAPRGAELAPVGTIPIPVPGRGVAAASFRGPVFRLAGDHIVQGKPSQSQRGMLHPQRLHDRAVHEFEEAVTADQLGHVGRQQNRRWGPLLFDAQAPRGEDAAEQITLGFLPWPYRVSYAWDATQGRYLRSFTPRRVAALCVGAFAAALSLLWSIEFVGHDA